MSLNDDLQALRAASLARLDPADWAGLAATIERLAMLQLAEQALALDDTLPDFALPDSTGRLVTGDELLDRAPLVLAFFRGGWCPYCDCTLQALEAARPALEAIPATLVGVAPCTPAELARLAAAKGLRFPLLSDTGGALARLCGLLYDMTATKRAYYRDRRGLDLPAIAAGTGWEIPIPATYVIARDGTVAYAFAEPDWARRAEPEELIEASLELARPSDEAASCE